MRCTRLVFLAACALSTPILLAHATLLSPVPRTPLTTKTGPCGGVPRTDDPLVLEAGSRLEVTWDEYVDHPGFYRLLFSRANDQGFAVLLDRIPDGQIPAGQAGAIYTATVTLPGEPCEAGTLQLIQVMMEDPQIPRYYFSCADIRLVAPAGPEPNFRRGDANSDGKVDMSDAVSTFVALFAGGAAPACFDAADANDDGAVDISDGIRTLLWLFAAGAEPPAPGPAACGEDPTEDSLARCAGQEGLCGG